MCDPFSLNIQFEITSLSELFIKTQLIRISEILLAKLKLKGKIRKRVEKKINDSAQRVSLAVCIYVRPLALVSSKI